MTRFNTTLVQLKATTGSPQRSLGSRFNTTLVQLKEFHLGGGELFAGCFNTTLVQLKVVVEYDDVHISEVSIPLWSN